MDEKASKDKPHYALCDPTLGHTLFGDDDLKLLDVLDGNALVEYFFPSLRQ